MTSITSVTRHMTIQDEIIQAAKAASSASVATSGNAATAPAQNSAVVSISGEAIMIARLFGGSTEAAQKVEYQLTVSNLSGSFCNFLTLSDRATLAKVYEYASANGIDLKEVDWLAVGLGTYRACGPSPAEGALGQLWESATGNPIVGNFSDETQAIANSVLTSKAMNDTALDHGFIESLFNPDKLGASYTMDRQGVSKGQEFLAAVRQIVFAFSASGSDGASDPARVTERAAQLAARDAKIASLKNFYEINPDSRRPTDVSPTDVTADPQTQLLNTLLKNNGATDLSDLLGKLNLSLADLAKTNLLHLLNRSTLIASLNQDNKQDELTPGQ
jgi:hypothetical protein